MFNEGFHVNIQQQVEEIYTEGLLDYSCELGLPHTKCLSEKNKNINQLFEYSEKHTSKHLEFIQQTYESQGIVYSLSS